VWTTGCDEEAVLELRNLMPCYLQQSDLLYSGDAEGQSRQVLTATAMALLVDREACREFPLLQEHRVGIDVGMLCRILVPLPQQKKLLAELEEYVWSRDRVALFPSPTDVNLDQDSFSVRFQKQSADMELLRLRLLDMCGFNQQKKAQEVEKALARHQTLLDEAAQEEEEARRLQCQFFSRNWAALASCRLNLNCETEMDIMSCKSQCLALAQATIIMKRSWNGCTAQTAQDVGIGGRLRIVGLRLQVLR